MLCRQCKERELTPSKIKKADYLCYRCEYLRNGGPNRQREHRHTIRNQLHTHYGNSCIYCGAESNLQFDHVNGDGKQHREAGQDKWFRFLIHENYPPVCQVVCRQCNLAKQQMTDAEFKTWILTLAYKLQCNQSHDYCI